MKKIKDLEDAETQGQLDTALKKIKDLEDAGTQEKLDTALNKIKELEEALADKANITYVDIRDNFVLDTRRKRAAAQQQAGSSDGKPNGRPEAPALDDKTNANANPNDDSNANADAKLCPDQEDPQECAVIDALACGTLFSTINVTEFCQRLCNDNCNDSENENDATEPAKSKVSMIVGIVAPLLILIGIGVAVLMLRKKEQGRQRALTRSRPARTAARNNPAFTADDDAAFYLEPTPLQSGAHNAAQPVENSLYGGDSSTYSGVQGDSGTYGGDSSTYDSASSAAGNNLGYAAIDGAQQTYAGGNDDDYDMPDGYTGDNSAV